MKTLHVFTVPVTRNGITMFALERADALSRAGISMDFAAGNAVEPSLLREIEARGIRVHRLASRRPGVGYVLELAKLIRKNRYDLVHAHGNSSSLFLEMLAAALGGCGLRVAHCHNTTSLRNRQHRRVLPLFLLSYTAAAACGTDAGRWLFGRGKFTVLPNAVDAGRFRFDPEARKAVRPALGLENALVLGHVGRFNAQKNHAFLLEIFEEVLKRRPDARLLLVGDGYLEEEIRWRAKPLGDRVVFAGSVPDPERFLAAMDVMALPSLYEGFPTVLLEWQAAGLPSLVGDAVTKEAALTDLVRFLPLREGAASWAEALLALDRPDRAKASAGAIESILSAGYGLDRAAETLLHFYAELSRR